MWAQISDGEWYALFAACFTDGRAFALLPGAVIIDCDDYVRCVALDFDDDEGTCTLKMPICDWYWYTLKSGQPFIINTPAKTHNVWNGEVDNIYVCDIYDEKSTREFHRILRNICKLPVWRMTGLP